MSNAYRSSLASGGGTAVGDATASDVLTGKTFSGVVGSGVTGTMPNRGADTRSIAAGGSYTIPEGYHNGLGIISAIMPAADDFEIVALRGATADAITCQVGDIIVGINNSFQGVGYTYTGCTEIEQYPTSGVSTYARAILAKATATTINIIGATSGGNTNPNPNLVVLRPKQS